jgi:hypothetical protein
MLHSRVKAIPVIPGQECTRLSQGQKTFNRLLKQIETKRTRLADWNEAVTGFHSRFRAELLPLTEATTDLEIKMVHALDQAADWKGLTRRERQDLTDLIISLAGNLVSRLDDPSLKAIYNKHSKSDYDREEAEHVADMKSALEGVFGVTLGDDFDPTSPEELLQLAQALFQERDANQAAERQNREARRAPRKKTAKQLAREAEQEAQKQQIGQSIREIYRKLASALHPDREPDPEERTRKTALMQQVNLAYEGNNLLKLLELQLELEQIDQSAIANISEVRLSHYNVILREQVTELDIELHNVEDQFRDQYGIAPFTSLSPSTLPRLLKSDIAETRQHIRQLESDLTRVAEIKTLKVWLRGIRNFMAENDFGHDFDPGSTPRRKKRKASPSDDNYDFDFDFDFGP